MLRGNPQWGRFVSAAGGAQKLVILSGAQRSRRKTGRKAGALYLFPVAATFRAHMTADQIRQSFLDFFRAKEHAIVPSASLLPDSPNLLFTNAGMNQFVPIFLGKVRCPYTPGRAADTQKCIRAGGKHNDLDDVGLDTYHHTFFEMLGNWSFGDYFKKEAIEWAWELIVEEWGFPAERLYATVYNPDKAAGDPADFDAEAWNLWAAKFESLGLDPTVHIVNGNKKDNFWMMGDTGPCGPCSELHVDLTPLGDTRGSLVNMGDPRCIEIWNLVFIQFVAQPSSGAAAASAARSPGASAERSPGSAPVPGAVSGVSPESGRSPGPASIPARGEGSPGDLPPADGTSAATRETRALPVDFVPLAQRHVDTGMGFERVASIIQGTKNFTDFANAKISNYETDIFRPIFDELEKMSGKIYRSTLPGEQIPPPPATGGLSEFIEATSGAVQPDSPAVQSPPPAMQPGSEEDEPMLDASSTVFGSFAAPVVESNIPGVIPDPGPDVPVPVEVSAELPPSPPPPPVEPPAPLANVNPRATPEQIAIDIAFRVIADHIRTLSFAIADGISPGNTDRNYVLRRILRRAVRYGRTLGFTEPFFYQLAATLARTMGPTFPELRDQQKHIEEVLKREEEAFNKTLDRGIELFASEAAKLLGSARVPRVPPGVSPGGPGAGGPGAGGLGGGGASGETPDAARETRALPGATYHRRRLPHFERPWAKYLITFTTQERRELSPAARTITLDAVRHFDGKRYELYAVVVMPDHVHVLFEPGIKETGADGQPVFWALSELLHSIKSFTAHKIQDLEGGEGIWEKEWHDRMIRSEEDLEEKFQYVVGNPGRTGVVGEGEDYEWVWWAGREAEGTLAEGTSRRDAEKSTRDACATGAISGAFAFRLYDEQGFPLDLTELMARERGLSVDVEGFNKLMEEQRARARSAQKKEIIEVSQIETTEPTKFVGYETLERDAEVLEIVGLKGKTAVITEASTFYAEMGGQVGDTGEMSSGGQAWTVAATQKAGKTWLHFIEPVMGEEAPAVGATVRLAVDRGRRAAIERHHTVTHLLHWALHEVVGKEATQKGSFVGPEKLTFDFNSAALTGAQVRAVERLVNERIVENAAVSWTEVPYAEVKARGEVMQFFGDKYGATVRVVQIGGKAGALDGFSMELCGGTHTRATGEIGAFRIVSEAAIASGVRRIEAVAGRVAYDFGNADAERLRALAAKMGAPLGELERKLEAMFAKQEAMEKEIALFHRKQAAHMAASLMEKIQKLIAAPAIIEAVPGSTGDELAAIAEALRTQFNGVVVLAGATPGNVALLATVSEQFVGKFSAGKIIQAIAPLVGGKGGGKSDLARGAGKEPAKVTEALAAAQALLRE